MVRRQSFLALSITFSLVMHGALLAVSPRISILSSLPDSPLVKKSFRIQLRDDAMTPPPPREGEATLASRPGSLEDLLNRDLERLKPSESAIKERSEVPQLSDRVASETLPREHELQADEAVSRAVDARIIEISEETARKDIEVPRRLVSPSSTRILAEGELPTLTGDFDPAREEMLAFSPLPGGGLGGLPAGGAGEAAREAALPPPRQEPLVEAPASEPNVTALLDEKVIARAPVAEHVRKEHPYEFLDDVVTIGLDTYRATGEKEGFFRVRIAPKEAQSLEVLPKDVTFVVDASKSIVQRKLDLTAAGVKAAVKMLRPEDYFNIVIFRDTATMFRAAAVPATPENKTAANVFLTGQRSYGETDVYKALEAVIAIPPRPGIPGIVLVITDGRPTTGVRDGRTIINALTEANTRGNTIFAYGGGRTVNRYLLDLLAYRNKGESFVSPQADTIDRDLTKFIARLNEPILANCAVDYGGITGTEVYPLDIPDFYRGRAVTVYGKFDPAKDKEFFMRLTGLAGARKKEVIFRADLRKAGAGDLEVARSWAFNKIYFLIGEICRVGEKPELLAELRDLSRKYKIKTSYDE